jgi:NADP-dependent 3-hydroxy acid dehydrogenase YdfG
MYVCRNSFEEVGFRISSMHMDSFEEKTALITGASSGVGRAIALDFARLGVRVLLAGRNTDKLRNVQDEILRLGGTAESFQVDLSNDQQLQNFAEHAQKRLPRLDFLVHSAGVFRMAPIATATLEDFDSQYRCNVRAPFFLTQALLPQLIAARGAIAFINSTAGETSHPNISQYAASKHALKALADTLRLELKGQGVRVLSLMLGRTATPMQEEVCRLEGSTYDGDRFLQPCDVARSVVAALTLPASAEVTNLYLRPAQAAPPVSIATHRPPAVEHGGRWHQRPQVRPEPSDLVPRG